MGGKRGRHYHNRRSLQPALLNISLIKLCTLLKIRLSRCFHKLFNVFKVIMLFRVLFLKKKISSSAELYGTHTLRALPAHTILMYGQCTQTDFNRRRFVTQPYIIVGL
jgi:hypothetical protein